VEFVDPSEGIGNGLYADHPHDLGEGFAVGFDIIGTPQDTCDRFFARIISSVVVKVGDGTNRAIGETVFAYTTTLIFGLCKVIPCLVSRKR
jgi:hypothetical protein